MVTPANPWSRSATTERIRKRLEEKRCTVANLAGQAGADWAISQLSTSPFVVIGWPNPCKAARMSMRTPQRKAARA